MSLKTTRSSEKSLGVAPVVPLFYSSFEPKFMKQLTTHYDAFCLMFWQYSWSGTARWFHLQLRIVPSWFSGRVLSQI